MGIFFVKRESFFIEEIDGFPGLHDDPPGIQVGKPLLNGREIQNQVDDDAARSEMVHGRIRVHHAPSGSDDHSLAGKRKDVMFFDPAEGFDPLLVDDLLQGPPLLGLDEDIRIDEIPGCGFGEKNPDRAFADGRHADQHNVRILLEGYNFCHFFFENNRK
jgi:hypothetical protein